nr:SDR family oxidoreductase [Alcanivorax sp.]
MNCIGAGVAHFGRVDAACNNAGIEAHILLQSAHWTTDTTLATNLRGLFLCMKTQLGLMTRQGHGAIVNIASVAGLVGSQGSPRIAPRKEEWFNGRTASRNIKEHNIRVNAVCPRAIKTEMIDRITGKEPETEPVCRPAPHERMGTPEGSQRRDLAGFATGKLCHRSGTGCGWRDDRSLTRGARSQNRWIAVPDLSSTDPLQPQILPDPKRVPLAFPASEITDRVILTVLDRAHFAINARIAWQQGR